MIGMEVPLIGNHPHIPIKGTFLLKIGLYKLISGYFNLLPENVMFLPKIGSQIHAQSKLYP